MRRLNRDTDETEELTDGDDTDATVPGSRDPGSRPKRRRTRDRTPSGVQSSDGSDDESRRNRRLLANRLSAARSRAKKLSETSDLEGQVEELSRDVDGLKAQLSTWQARHQALLSENVRLLQQLRRSEDNSVSSHEDPLSPSQGLTQPPPSSGPHPSGALAPATQQRQGEKLPLVPPAACQAAGQSSQVTAESGFLHGGGRAKAEPCHSDGRCGSLATSDDAGAGEARLPPQPSPATCRTTARTPVAAPATPGSQSGGSHVSAGSPALDRAVEGAAREALGAGSLV